MGANMLDTYTLVKRPTKAGVPEAQAEAHMSVFLDMSERGFANKGDIAELKKRIDDLATHVADMDTRLSGVEAHLAGMDVRLAGMDLRLSGMELRLMVRLGGLIVTLMSVGFGVLEFTLAH
jgi:hypothetical protein